MKDLKISKELLSKVLKKEIIEFAIEKNELRYILKDDINDINGIPELYFINIYVFVFKCKEWVLKQGYRIIIDCSKDIKVGIRILKNGRDIYSNENKSEVEAIIKACEWVLKEQNNDTK